MKVLLVLIIVASMHVNNAYAIDPFSGSLIIGNIKIRNSAISGNLNDGTTINASSDNAPESKILGEIDECENLIVLSESLSEKALVTLEDTIDGCKVIGDNSQQ